MRLLILLIAATTILATSCTIQKRSFRNGYYISWNKSVPKEKSASKDEVSGTEKTTGPIASKDSVSCIEEPKSPADVAVIEKPDTLQASVVKADSTEKRTSDGYSEDALMKHLGEAVESMKEPKVYQIEEEASGKRLNLFSLNSLVFSIGYVILLFATLNLSGQNVTLAIAGIVICAILAIVFAIIGLVKWGRDRTGFWGTFFSVIALGLLVVGLLVFLLYFLTTLSFG